MRLIVRLFRESVLFALNALVINKLRTFLSLLGVTIGIFAIISVFTMVDSMERGIKESIASLGENVVFVQKWPWSFGSEYPWWKYIKRPVPSIRELEKIKEQCEGAAAVTFIIEVRKNVEYGSSVMENVVIVSASHDYDKVRNFEMEKGRYFTSSESLSGKPKVVLGARVAFELFGPINPIDREVEIVGHQFTVVGVFKREGDSMVGASTDELVVVPLNFTRKLIDINSKRMDPRIMVKAREGVTNTELIDELTGILRASRKLRPKQDNTFALNETSLLSNGFDQLFSAVEWAGFIIGFFSILVGGFGIANIMFVSVKERTPIIGIQKSLGARNSFILFQFLSEAVILCVIGGLIGLLIILLGSWILSAASDFDVVLTMGNVGWGMGISTAIGLISGILPALAASKLDPVEAIRAN